MSTTAAETVHTRLVGAWTLVSYETRRTDGGGTVHPLGADARGIIMYTPDGFMSAQIMRTGRPNFATPDLHGGGEQEFASAAEGYLAYSGPFAVSADGATVTHGVSVSLFPNWVGGVQARVAVLSGSRLELSSPEPVLIRGEPRTAHLVWQRAERN
ncbi:MAG TPA: lipocalin-like domain-containing protein [Amycolatopsis sp.]|nr:lipocalin-like domain-containing protein [Amycolatopsis sp.]